MKKIGFILFLVSVAVLLKPQQLFSQPPPTSYNGYMRTDLISPSPNAANLGRYGAVPITYYTGLPNVSIPIFTVEGNDLKLPITLTYNYNGYKPAEKASWAGLGWSLQAGGVITRTLGDKLDEHFQGGPEGYSKIINLQDWASQTFLRNAYANGAVDLAPDIFNFNFGSYSGQFILYNGEFFVTPYQGIKISGNAATGFTIITEDGTKYQFAIKESTKSKSLTGNEPYIIPEYYSAWYLNKITNAANTESITLEYSIEGPITQSGTMVQTYQKFIEGLILTTIGQVYNASVVFPPSAAFQTRVETAMRLRSIHSEKHIVNFSVNDGYPRLDIQGSAYGLTGIMILSADNRFIKSYQLNTEYYESFPNRVLKLKNVREYDSVGTEFIEHAFEYENEDNFFAASNAGAVDHFGYLNAAGNNDGTYFPPSILPNSGVNREPVFAFAKQGALKRITYPTGGYTEMEYAPNTFYDGMKFNYNYWFNGVQAAIPNNVPHTAVKTRIDTFSTNYPQSVDLYVTRASFLNTDSIEEVDHESVWEVKIQRIADGDTYETIGTYKIEKNTENNGKTFKINLPDPGMFLLTTQLDGSETLVSANLTAKKRWVRDTIEGRLGAGIRLKKVIEHPLIGKPVTRLYKYSDDLRLSTGSKLNDSTYSRRLFSRTAETSFTGLQLGRVLMEEHTSVVSESTETQLPFYYSRVTEDVVSENSITRTRYYFDHKLGANDADLVRQIDYKFENGVFSKIRQIDNTYTSYPFDVFTTHSIFRTDELTLEGSGGEPILTYDYEVSGNRYFIWKFQSRSKQTQYAGTDSLVTETSYYYNVDRNLAGVKTKGSDGATLYTNYKYPSEYHVSVTGLPSNVVTPIEEQVWKRPPSGDSVMISGKIYRYNALNKIDKIYAFESPTGVTSLDNETRTGIKYNKLVSDSRYKSKIDFTYHTSGRLISQKSTDDAPITYLWGYPANESANSPSPWLTRPIAEIRNALPEEVFYESFEDQFSPINSTHAFSKTGRASRKGGYTILKSFTGTYKLTYWKKTGSSPWQLVESTLTNPSNVSIATSNDWIDEVRLYPIKSMMRTFSYANSTALSEMNDSNNIILRYKYDSLGRLMSVRDDKGNILSNYQYHYANSGNQ